MGTQGRVVGETKYGQDPNGGLLFYTESWTWTVGWIPALAAVAGAVLLFRRDRRTAWVLVPVVPLFIVYMGWQTRYFGRWMLPVLPIVLMLAAYAGWRAIEEVRRRRPSLAVVGTAVVVAALCAQSLVHVDPQRPRPLAAAHAQPRARMDGRQHPEGRGGRRRAVAGSLLALAVEAGPHRPADAVRLTQVRRVPRRRPRRRLPRGGLLLDRRELQLLGPDPQRRTGVSDARAYYETLAREGDLVFEASPWGAVDSHGYIDDDEVPFDFDFSYDFYPLAYDRPGPRVHVYHLRGGECGGGAP